ncbi:MAG: gamma carbonic anhydrase family protein [Deltaproteobacteria bacterium]|nr:MAG: gamma carbonic anhydrase family protein [Deltaproteobacteria bacterium]
MLIEFEGRKPRIGNNVFIAPTAVLIGDVEVGDDSSIWFGAVLRGDLGPIRVGKRCSIQDNVSIHVFDTSPTIVHDDVTVGHNCVLEGCELGRGTLIGMNSTVLPFAKTGEQVMLAAGSVISEGATFGDRLLLAGAPARVKKELSGNALEWTNRAAKDYVTLKGRYLDQGIGTEKGQ